MFVTPSRLLTLIGLCLCLHFTLAAQAPTQRTLIMNTNIVDVKAGKVLRGYDVMLEGHKITQVIPTGKILPSPGLKVIIGANRYLVPGLWDMWTRSEPGFYLSHLYISRGIIGISSMNTPLDRINADRDSIDKGRVYGPIMYGSGPVLDGVGTTANEALILDSPAAVRQSLDSLQKAGAHFFQLGKNLSPEVHESILRLAGLNKWIVSGAVPAGLSWADAANRGQNCIDWQIGEIPDLVQATSDLTALAYRHTYLRPSLHAWHNFLFPDSIGDQMAGMNNAHSAAKFYWRIDKSEMEAFPVHSAEGRQNLWQQLQRFTKYAWERGIPMLAGSHSLQYGIWPGEGLTQEMRALHECGIPMPEVLKMAISNPTEYLGISDRFGSIEAGKYAHMIFLTANPLESVEAFNQIEGLFFWGTLLDVNDLYTLSQQ